MHKRTNLTALKLQEIPKIFERQISIGPPGWVVAAAEGSVDVELQLAAADHLRAGGLAVCGF